MPPYLLHVTYAVYVHLLTGDLDPVPFAERASWGTTERVGVYTLPPDAGVCIFSRHGEPAPLRNLILSYPVTIPVEWVSDYYGVPLTNAGIEIGGWHGSPADNESSFGGLFLRDPVSCKVLNVWDSFSPEEVALFFSETLNLDRLDRYRNRLLSLMGVPFDVAQCNSESIKRLLEKYPGVLPRQAEKGVHKH
jgi:hypothetical protein